MFEIEITEQLKLALNYAEESSKRVRSVLFLLQLAVVLVLYGIWQQADLNWSSLRVERAEKAVMMLMCGRDQIAYTEDIGGKKTREILDELKNHKNLTPEDIDDVLSCSAMTKAFEEEQKKHPTSPQYLKEENKRTLDYLQNVGFSLTQGRKNLDNLRKARSDRALGVGVPILGIIFDVNDLSVIAAITFSIMLSWLHFSLRRQKKNVQKVFGIAEAADIAQTESGKANQYKTLRVAYDLLAMSQVLTIPPGNDPESRNVSLGRLWTRVPALIMCTAVVAQLSVLVDDIITMGNGDILNPFISHSETVIATYLFAYIIYRTITCFNLNRETYVEWVEAHNKSKQNPHIEMGKENQLSIWMLKCRRGIGAVLLLVCGMSHVVDEWYPTYRDGFRDAWHLTRNLSQWLGCVMLLLTFVLCIWRKNARVGKISAWSILVLGATDIAVHNLHAARAGFWEHMEGLYTSLLIVIGSAIFLVVSARDNVPEPPQPEPPQPPEPPQGAAASVG